MHLALLHLWIAMLELTTTKMKSYTLSNELQETVRSVQNDIIKPLKDFLAHESPSQVDQLLINEPSLIEQLRQMCDQLTNVLLHHTSQLQ